uniref:General transcription and DNA repair factor IIH subunit TFB5 n=1 Tax=Amphiprion percula TaxID=161767 RepID=A0A3P8TCQ4_AMPPE
MPDLPLSLLEFTVPCLVTAMLDPLLHNLRSRSHLVCLWCCRSGSLSFASTAKFSAPVNMVNVHKGVLVECDPAMKQFLLYLDETMALGKKFILKDLDDTHLFILAEVVHTLQDRVGELMDQNSFPITQK